MFKNVIFWTLNFWMCQIRYQIKSNFSSHFHNFFLLSLVSLSFSLPLHPNPNCPYQSSSPFVRSLALERFGDLWRSVEPLETLWGLWRPFLLDLFLSRKINFSLKYRYFSLFFTNMTLLPINFANLPFLQINFWNNILEYQYFMLF